MSDNKSRLNDWFLSLPEERRIALLNGDRWMLADAAFEAGIATHAGAAAAEPVAECPHCGKPLLNCKCWGELKVVDTLRLADGDLLIKVDIGDFFEWQKAPLVVAPEKAKPVGYANPVIMLPDDAGDEGVEWTARIQSHPDSAFSMPLYASPLTALTSAPAVPEAITEEAAIDLMRSLVTAGRNGMSLAKAANDFIAAHALKGVQPGERGEGGDWYREDHPEHLMGHDDCNGMGIIESARIPMFVALLKSARQHAREAEQFRDDVVAQVRNRLKRAACPKCAQTDAGQTGEYPCAECGLPTVWDAAPKSERGEG